MLENSIPTNNMNKLYFIAKSLKTTFRLMILVFKKNT